MVWVLIFVWFQNDELHYQHVLPWTDKASCERFGNLEADRRVADGVPLRHIMFECREGAADETL